MLRGHGCRDKLVTVWLPIGVDAFAALADPVRRAILVELTTGSRRVVDLSSQRHISRPAISRHLRLLLEAGLVEAAPRGRERHYRLAADGLEPVRSFLDQLSGPQPRFAESDLDALALEVRRTVREHGPAATERHTPSGASRDPHPHTQETG